MKALVTGGGGFIGGHLVARLLSDGARVRALLRYTSRADRGTLDYLEPATAAEVEVARGDLRDADAVAAAVGGADVVFHLGALIAIPYSYVNPREYFETNVLGSLNVAQAARAAGVGRVVHVSTSEVYGTVQALPITEAHPLRAQSPYAASKIGADQLMDSWQRSFGLPVVIVRPFNTYGPFQTLRAVVPTIIAQALAGGPVRLGSLEPRRDLTYVADTVAGLVAAASADAVGRTVQLGTGRDVSIGELVALVGEILGTELAIESDPDRVRPPDSEVDHLLSDPSLAAELLGWRAETPLRAGLERTAAWIEGRVDPERAGEYVT